MARFMGSDKVKLASDSDSLAVAGAVTIYTQSMRVKSAEYLAVSYQFASALGNPDVMIEVEQSFKEPAIEGAADADWVVAEGVSDIETSLQSETMRHKALNIPALSFLRFKITGNAANPADTVGKMYLSKQEE